MAKTIFSSVFACLVVFTVYTVLRQIRHAYLSRKNGCQDPRSYPHKDPVFGIDLYLRLGRALKEDRNLPEQLQLYKDSKTFQAISLGRKVIHTIEPENLRAIYTTDFTQWGVQPSRLAGMEPFCGRGFLTVDGNLWHRSRRMFAPSFEKKAIADFSALERFTRRMIEQLPADGQTVDIQPLLSSLFIDATTLFLFGESFSDLPGPSTAADVSKAFDEAMYGSGMRNAIGSLRFVGKQSEWKAACRKAQSFTEAYVDKALEHRREVEAKRDVSSSSEPAPGLKPTKNVLLYSLAEQTSDREHLRNEIMQAFFVSQGTTAYLVANVLFLASRHPLVWSKMKAEVSETIQQESVEQRPSYGQLQRMSYLRAVISEALRLYPILAHNSRVALKTTTLPTGGGPDGKYPILIPSGTKVNTSYFSLHRQIDIWGPDVSEFKPDRWLLSPGAPSQLDEKDPGKGYEYLPFGAGPRRCIGQDKGLVEAAYVLVSLLREFKTIESRDERDWKGHVALSAYNTNGCLVAFSR